MAGNTENQYGGASNNETNAGGSWGAAPPIMHSWCLQPDGPSESRDSKSRLQANDADDDCGFDLNLGLSLGGGKNTKAKSRDKEKEKEVVLDRDVFRERGEHGVERRDGVVVPKDEEGGGVMFKALKTEPGGGNLNSNRVQSFWQDLDRSGNEAKEKAAAGTTTQFPPRQNAPNEHNNQQVVEASNWAGVNSVAEDSKMFAQHMWQALQGKAAQPEHQRVPLSARDEASLIKELQGLPPQAVATAAAWARVVAQGGFPVQLLEAIKEGVDQQGVALQQSISLKSHSEAGAIPTPVAVSPGPSGDLERSDSDVSKNMHIDTQHRQVAIIQQQELVEQQRKREQMQKRQEARRKRKALLEGQKSKKTKKEEGSSKSGNSLESPPPNRLQRTSSLQQQPLLAASKENSLSPPNSQDAAGASSVSAFRRPGSSSWLHNSFDVPGAAAKGESLHGAVDPGEQMVEIRRALERVRDNRGVKDSHGGDVDGGVAPQVDSSSESRKVGSPDVVQMQRMDLESRQINPAWIQKIMEVQLSSHQLSAMMENNREIAGKMAGSARRGDAAGEIVHPAENVVKKRARGVSESSSGGTESSGGGQDGGRGTDAESPVAGTAGDGRLNSTAMPSLGSNNAVAMANMAFPPGGGFPMMPSPFPFPLPVPPGGAPGGVPFSMPFPFPYLMQFAPSPGSGGDGNNQEPQQRAPHPGLASPFQIALPPGFNPPFQIQMPEAAAAWTSALVRPHAATPPQSPPQNAAAAKSGQPGLSREDEKHGGRGAKNNNDHARTRNVSGGNESSSSSAQALLKANSLGSGAFNRLRSTTAAAAATATPANNGSPRAPHFGLTRSKSDAVTLRREGSAGSAFAALVEPFPGQANNTGSKGVSCGGMAVAEEGGASASANRTSLAADGSPSDENVRRGPQQQQQQPTGVWREGSVPSFEDMGGHEAASLRPGVAPGVQFGGTGSPPDLPWVTCNGTISGVLYRVEKGQVRIVCACHGRHMTPAEFVQHAGCGEIPNPEKAIVVGPFTVQQQPASAQA